MSAWHLRIHAPAKLVAGTMNPCAPRLNFRLVVVIIFVRQCLMRGSPPSLWRTIICIAMVNGTGGHPSKFRTNIVWLLQSLHCNCMRQPLTFYFCLLLISFLFHSSACRWRKLILVRLLANKWPYWWVSDTYDIFRWGDHQPEVSISNQEMGCGWRCWQETLGNYKKKFFDCLGISYLFKKKLFRANFHRSANIPRLSTQTHLTTKL